MCSRFFLSILFSFSEDFASVIVFACNIFKAYFYEFKCFLSVMGYFSMVFVSFVAIKQCLLYGDVYQRVFDVSMSKHFFYVEYVFGFVVFHRGFPVSEGVESYP